jgi:hypothetical protein
VLPRPSEVPFLGPSVSWIPGGLFLRDKAALFSIFMQNSLETRLVFEDDEDICCLTLSMRPQLLKRQIGETRDKYSEWVYFNRFS